MVLEMVAGRLDVYDPSAGLAEHRVEQASSTEGYNSSFRPEQLDLFLRTYALRANCNTVQLSAFRNCRMALLKRFARHLRALNNAN